VVGAAEEGEGEMKLTKQVREDLRFVLRNAERARAYLFDPQIAIARRGNHATITLHYVRADGETLYEVNKDLGSDLTGLDAAISALGAFLATH
jgi:hypothetical protein